MLARRPEKELNTSMKTIKYIIIALVFFVAGWLLGQSYGMPFLPKVLNPQNQETQNSATNNQATSKVTYIINYGDSDFKTEVSFNDDTPLSAGVMEFQDVAFNEGETVLDLLKRLAQENNLTLVTKDYAGLGTLVEKIGDQANGTDNKYWYYRVNDLQPQVGAAQYQLQNGERIEWRFEELQVTE